MWANSVSWNYLTELWVRDLWNTESCFRQLVFTAPLLRNMKQRINCIFQMCWYLLNKYLWIESCPFMTNDDKTKNLYFCQKNFIRHVINIYWLVTFPLKYVRTELPIEISEDSLAILLNRFILGDPSNWRDKSIVKCKVKHKS